MKRFNRFVVPIAALALLSVTGCGNELVAAQVCDGVTCSDHGQCAVAADEAVCICNGGYHAVDLTCVQNVAGAECTGIGCSAHGTCVVASDDPPYPVCICDNGYHAVGTDCQENVVGVECNGISCSDHGTCVIAYDSAEPTPLCVCETGYHAAGLACDANVVGAECDGVDCSENGNCVVVADATPYPVCICKPGFRNVGDTNCGVEPPTLSCGTGTHESGGQCVPNTLPPTLTCGDGTHEESGRCVADAPSDAPCSGITCSSHGTCTVEGASTPSCTCDSGFDPYDYRTGDTDGYLQCVRHRCTSNAECDGTDVCSRATGSCVGAVCGTPPAEGGTVTKGQRCHLNSANDNQRCAANLTCVPNSVKAEITGDTLSYVPDSESLGAIALCLEACNPCSSNCSPGEDCIALPGGGGFCSTGLVGPGGVCYQGQGICAANLACNGGLSCLAYCTPDDIEYVKSGSYAQASRSADCGEGEPCVAYIGVFSCEPKKLAGLGQRCDGNRICEFPAVCAEISHDRVGREDLACSPGAGCSNSADCGGVADCFGGQYCIADGALGYGQSCFESRNCENWLVCRSDGLVDRCLAPL